MKAVDYISRAAALQKAERDSNSKPVIPVEAIENITAAEVRAVRRVYWREDALNFSNGNYELECPFCECQMALNGCSRSPEYCPHCGEKLDFMRW